MRLEDEIKSDKFESIHQKAMLQILFTASWFNNHHDKLLKPAGISAQQYNILRILRGAYPEAISMKEIKARALNKTPHLTRMTQKLLQAGLIQCSPDPKDKRVTLNSITPVGLELLESLNKAMQQIDAISHKLDANEAQLLSDLLEKIRS